MNDLVERLLEKCPVEASRPEKTVKALRDSIERNYVHIMFKQTGTELGIRLDQQKCDISKADFEQGTGTVHLEGALTLNYDKVICIADIDLNNLEGTGCLELAEESEYTRIIEQSEF